MEASKLRALRELSRSLADPRLGVIVRKGEFDELLDYISSLEEKNSDLMYECSALHEERRQWWTGDIRTAPTMSDDVAKAINDLKEVLSEPTVDKQLKAELDLGTAWGEDYVSGTGQRLRVHRSEDCNSSQSVDSYCVIHRPMPGPWSAWPTYWRSDAGFMERLCPHGVGHPVPEAAGFDKGRGGSHGCCGCPCSPAAAGRVPGP